MLNIDFLVKGNLEQLNKNSLITLILSCIKEIGGHILFSDWGGTYPTINILKENMSILFVSDDRIRVLPNPDVPLVYYDYNYGMLDKKQLLTVVQAMRDHVNFLQQKDNMLKLPEKRKIAVMIHMYYSLHDAGKDEFLRETENS